MPFGWGRITYDFMSVNSNAGSYGMRGAGFEDWNDDMLQASGHSAIT
jgi:hypothetical protein